MEKSLIIVESPTKVKTISKFLSDEFLVKSSLGHIRDLPQKKFGVNIDKNFTPYYITIPGKEKIIKELKSSLKNVRDIYLATDPDREGEAIAWHIKETLGLKNEKRIEFQEITKKAVENALLSPREIDLNLVDAQQTRRILDRIVGYKLSPLLWRKVKGGLSAGRVQSIAVLLIVEREKEIKEFKPEEYWEIIAVLKKETEETFEAKLIKKDSQKIEIKNEEEAKSIKSHLEKEEFIVNKIEIKIHNRNPSPPFITSTLCQEANRRFGFSTKRTMLIAQQLYEGIELGEEGPVGLITYMRTDSLRVSEEIKIEAEKYIQEKFGENYLPREKRVYKSKKLAQEAHEAIRPTSVERKPESIKKYLDSSQFKLYQMIYQRFLASCMASSLIEVTTAQIKAGDYLFQAKGERTLFDGFRKIYKDIEEEEGKNNLLPELKEKERLILCEIKPSQHFTKPPPHYTEATLIKTLEEKGIGRPSTYAPIIETILNRKYVVREGKFLLATQMGKTVTELLLQNFKEIMNIEFTANLEEKLDKIEEGETKGVKILSDFYNSFKDTLQEAFKNIKRIKIEPEKSEIICEKCGERMVIREGKTGRFLACPKFPECKNTKPYTVGKCKIEGCGGEIIERRSKKGKLYYTCSNYPKCKFISRKIPN